MVRSRWCRAGFRGLACCPRGTSVLAFLANSDARSPGPNSQASDVDWAGEQFHATHQHAWHRVIEARRRALAGHDYGGDRATGDKVVRAGPRRSQAEGGNVKLVRGDWNEDFLQELESFPYGAHDDQVDAAALAFNTLAAPPEKKPQGGTWGRLPIRS